SLRSGSCRSLAETCSGALGLAGLVAQNAARGIFRGSRRQCSHRHTVSTVRGCHDAWLCFHTALRCPCRGWLFLVGLGSTVAENPPSSKGAAELPCTGTNDGRSFSR